MNKKAYALIKGDKMIGGFHNSKRAVRKNYAKQLGKKGYTIGVFTLSHTEEASQANMVTLYTDSWGINYIKNNAPFYAVDENYTRDMSKFIEISVNEEDMKKASGDRYYIEKYDSDSVEIIGKVK